MQEQIETQRTSFDEPITEHETAFKDAEAARDTAAKGHRDIESEQAAELIEELQKYRGQAKDLLDATSRDVISGDYRGWATKQSRLKLRGLWFGVR